MTKVEVVCARNVFDSRGNPTVEVDVITRDGIYRSIVPSGASTGTNEALELRDNSSDYHGKGVSKAIENINKIIGPELVKSGIDIRDQERIDNFLIELDKTEMKTNLGANAILGVSMACARAGAAAKSVPLYKHIGDLAENQNFVLPCPAFNVINGGQHASNKIVFQEFMIMPTGAKSFKEAMKMGTEIYHHLKNILKKEYNQETQVGDEGGFAPNFDTPTMALTVISKAIEVAGYKGKVSLAMDSAASEFYDKKSKKYNLDMKDQNAKDKARLLSSSEMVENYLSLKKQFPNLISIEDSHSEDDWEGWIEMNSRFKAQLVADDLTVTNTKLIQKAIEKKACNALLLKVNQIGTVSESIKAAKLAVKNGWKVMVSHRSGETEDTFIADLVVGLGTGQIKSGAPCRTERLCKYNQLLRIEEEFGDAATYYQQLSNLVTSL